MTSVSPGPEDEPLRPLLKFDFKHFVRLWFGVSERVGPGAYALGGIAFMLLKYGVEATVVRITTSSIFSPWDFLNPVLGPRVELLRPGPEWLAWGWFLWTLPFVWMAVSMSVRRAADAGGSPWWGLVVLIPLVNLVFMLTMCFVPSKPGEQWLPGGRPAR